MRHNRRTFFVHTANSGEGSMSRRLLLGIGRAQTALLALCVLMSQSVGAYAAGFDLSSTAPSEHAPSTMSSPVSIMNGTTAMTVIPGMSLTPAQLMAVTQVLNNGMQSIGLSALGR